jgi:hypothetical protein
MSRRRRLGREPGRVRKTVEVLVSGLFGVAVVGVVVLVLQHGSAPAPSPGPSTSVSGQAVPTAAGYGGLGGIHSADTGAVTTPGEVRSASTGGAPGTAPAAQGATEAQETGATEHAAPTTARSASGGSQGTAAAGSSSTTGGTSTSGPSPSPSPSSTNESGLVGIVGGLVGGVLGLL